MKGAEVRLAQKTLRRNEFGQDYLQGDVDGDFGTETARACKRAKYWLGFTERSMLPTYGKHLHAQLTGEQPLSPEQKARRKARLKKAKETPLRLKALAEARKDEGMKEDPPYSNICPITKWWRLNGPWCAMATSKWYLMAGSKAFRRSVNWAYVPAMLSAAINGDHGMSLTRYPKPGDIVTFDWDDDGEADHTGIMVTEVSKGGKFRSIEGNTAVGRDSDGGEVMVRDRNISDVSLYHGRPAFIHIGK